ncbi:MAG: metal-dependent hydrolase [Acidobacteria bacterium]|nr:metal-dependent hydrolase [Acidobacteriota bacterium]
MDNVTHTLTGVLLARAGLDRLSPRATVLLIAASNIADADIAASAWGSLAYLEYHRHITHALAAGPVMGLVTALCFFWLKDWKFGPAWLLCTIGVWVHILLDLLNNYGVRIWLPFHDGWIGWDLLMVIDPWLLAGLGLCVVAPMFARLVGGEIGARPRGPGRGWAVIGLLFFALWTGGRIVLHERALETLRARMHNNETPVRVAAWPTPWNPFAWRGYVSTESAWLLYDYSLRGEFDPSAARIYFKPSEAAALNAVRRTPEAQAFLRFSQFPVWRITPLDDGAIVEATDVRFGAPEDGKFQLSVQLDGTSRTRDARFSFGNPAKGFGVIRDGTR